jgi:hypothetical protein
MSKAGETQRQTAAEKEALALKIREWVDSAEGAEKLLEAQKAVRAALEVAESYSSIDPELLQKPVTL